MNTSTDDALERARMFVATVLEQPLSAIPIEGDVETIPAWDSLAHVRLLLAIENENGRQLDTEALSMLRSIRDVATLLNGAKNT